ncbi:MAG: hypothetical protein HKP37_06365 [Boseongicola sp.]|nr:hypothetical protein [Boseongicola sp.]NNL18347.1 hypothetical protein [Boseongicola sp.]
MSRSPEPVFLERQSYRRRRLSDAARMTPVVGLVLILLPLLWADQATTSSGILYVFSVWAILIAVTRVISKKLSDYEHFEKSTEEDDSGGGR